MGTTAMVAITDRKIKVENLHKSFGKNEILCGVDFEVEAGTVFCLLGSNGAGKTTTINIMTTLLKADSGSVKICGYDVVNNANEVRQHFSLTGQFAAVDELLTARENLVMIGRLSHMTSATARADELLERFRLTADANKRLEKFSGGMRRRLDIAMSLMIAPDVIFLDEPTTGLDPQNKLELWEIIDELRAGGTTIFLTTQMLEEAEKLADKIAILHEGKIIKEGRPEELKSLIKSQLLFTFDDLDELAKAEHSLADFAVKAEKQSLTLSVECGSEMSEVSAIIQRLSDCQVVSMQQQRASIEDVFLEVIGIERP
jgi:ABC-2 type transport system ATP-binding protein